MKVKKVLVCLLTAVALSTAVFGCGKSGTKKAEPVKTEAQAADQAVDQAAAQAANQTSQEIAVRLIIDGSKGEDKAISCSEDITVPEGATAYDALKAACDKNGLEITGEPSYVKTIGGLGEGSFGAAPCGWMYTIDGEYPTVAADKCTLEAGNEVIWEFTK